jgi:hypothetical protein
MMVLLSKIVTSFSPAPLKATSSHSLLTCFTTSNEKVTISVFKSHNSQTQHFLTKFGDAVHSTPDKHEKNMVVTRIDSAVADMPDNDVSAVGHCDTKVKSKPFPKWQVSFLSIARSTFFLCPFTKN